MPAAPALWSASKRNGEVEANEVVQVPENIQVGPFGASQVHCPVFIVLDSNPTGRVDKKILPCPERAALPMNIRCLAMSRSR